MKDEYGIEPAAAAPVTVAGGNAGDGAAAEEKSSFNVILKSAGASKLGVVKLLKDLLGVGLKEAKDLADAAPKAAPAPKAPEAPKTEAPKSEA